MTPVLSQDVTELREVWDAHTGTRVMQGTLALDRSFHVHGKPKGYIVVRGAVLQGATFCFFISGHPASLDPE